MSDKTTQPQRRPAEPIQPAPAQSVAAPANHGSLLSRWRDDPRALSPADVLHLQRTLGNRALLQAAPPDAAGQSAAIQLMRIGGQQIRPTGKNGKALWEQVRLAMFDVGLSPHGGAKVFKHLAKQDVDYDKPQTFIATFLNLAKAEVKRVAEARSQGQKKVRGWTRPLKIGRPAWPETYKTFVAKGQDIRHVVRNATLKNAIEAERTHQFKQYGEGRANLVMQEIAKAMGINGTFAHSIEVTTEIYKRAYLNLGNLFAGAGAINRVIGLTADHINNQGMEAIASDDFADAEWIESTFESVAYKISETSDQMDRQAEKMDKSAAETFLKGFEDFFDTITDYLLDIEEKFINMATPEESESEDERSDEIGMDIQNDMDTQIGVTKGEIGRVLIDIGANFGFDIPDEVRFPQEMEYLLKTEISLSQYQPGQPQQLAEILAHFMKAKALLQI